MYLFFSLSFFFFFNDTATTEIYTLSLHDALPIYPDPPHLAFTLQIGQGLPALLDVLVRFRPVHLIEIDHVRSQPPQARLARSEEHTSELQSRQYLVCRLLLEKKKKKIRHSSK